LEDPTNTVVPLTATDWVIDPPMVAVQSGEQVALPHPASGKA